LANLSAEKLFRLALHPLSTLTINIVWADTKIELQKLPTACPELNPVERFFWSVCSKDYADKWLVKFLIPQTNVSYGVKILKIKKHKRQRISKFVVPKPQTLTPHSYAQRR